MKLRYKAVGLNEIIKDLGKKEKQAGKALKATVNDMRRRVPGKVADEVRGRYNIKKAEIMPNTEKNKDAKKPKGKKAGRTIVKGETIDAMTFIYAGRPLSPTHFGMRPTEPKLGANGRWVQVSATVIKGRRRKWGRFIFLAKTGTKDKNKIPYITFTRKHRKPYKREPIVVKKTVSLPQMVSNKHVRPNIDKQINELLEKRLANNVKRFLE